MKFIDLEKLKVVKESWFKTKEIEVALNSQNTIFEMKELFRNALKPFFQEDVSLATHFCLKIENDELIKDLDAADGFFTTAVNVFCAVLFEQLCKTTGRIRERRLDVPENLRVAAINLSLLKRAINYTTYYNCFTISAEWGCNLMADEGSQWCDFYYDLLPEVDDNDN